MNNRGFTSFSLAILFAILLALFIFILLSPAKFIYDENIFIKNVYLIDIAGYGSEFVYQLKNQSPGPLYQYIHVVFEPLTGLHPVNMRILNFLHFTFLILTTFYYFKCLNQEEYLYKSLLYVFVPMSWVVIGLALTEMPAMMFLTSSLLFLSFILKHEQTLSLQKGVILSLLAGFLLGLSIVGRTQFLMVLVSSFCLFFFVRRYLYITIYIFSALVFPSCIFGIWKGIVPPDVQNLQQGFNLIYLFLSLGYLSLMTLFVCYRWFVLPKKFYLISLFITFLFLALNLGFHFAEFEMLKSVANKIPFNFFKSNYKYIVPAFLFGVSILYLTSCIYNFQRNRNNYWFAFVLVSGLLVVATTVKSSAQFSSRYVVQALPLFLMAYADKIVINKWSIILGVSGAFLGFLSLLTYYYG